MLCVFSRWRCLLTRTYSLSGSKFWNDLKAKFVHIHEMSAIYTACKRFYNIFTTQTDASSVDQGGVQSRRHRRPNRLCNPDDEIVVTEKCDLAVDGCAEHKRRRYEDLSNCRTIADAMQLSIQPTRTARPRKYSTSDLSYDITRGYVRVITVGWSDNRASVFDINMAVWLCKTSMLRCR